MTERSSYTFGDDELATARLELLARVFGPTSRVLLCRALGCAPRRPERVLDVGAGPGATTELLAEIVGPRELVGLDSSSRYVELARRRGVTSRGRPARFELGDVERGPLAEGGFELIYCRHVLAHVRDVARALEHLHDALAPEGVLALEETARLRSPHPVFERYYELVRGLQAAHGQRTFVGEELGGLARERGFDVRLAVCTRTQVDPAAMARLHGANLTRLRRDEFTRSRYSERDVDELAAELDFVARGRPAPPVEVTVGQLLVVRPGRAEPREG